MLEEAVQHFIDVTRSFSEADLARPWAWDAYREGVRFAFLRTAEELDELAAVLAVDRATNGPVITLASRALAQHQSAYRDWQAVMLGVEMDLLDRVPAEGEWPLRRVLAHLIGTERQFYARIHYAIDQ